MVEPSLVRQRPDRADYSTQQDKHRRSDSVDMDAVLEEGDRVEANYQRRGRYYPGVVTRVRLDGTVDVDYDDGEKESRIAAVDVRLNRARSASTKRRSGEGAQQRRRSSNDVDHLFSDDDDDDEQDRPTRRPPSRATSRSRERESSGEDHNATPRRSRSRNRSVSKGGDGLNGRRVGDSSSDSEPLRDGTGRRRSAGGRRSSSEGFSSTAKKRGGGEFGQGRSRSRSRSRNRGTGGGVASSSDEGDEGVRQGSWVEACWHRASSYSRPRRTSNWVSARSSVNGATDMFPRCCASPDTFTCVFISSSNVVQYSLKVCRLLVIGTWF